ncbi:MAG: metal ABC transporter solute-binding protein, Zn/Mn family [Patescibacteria group bacterium]
MKKIIFFSAVIIIIILGFIIIFNLPKKVNNENANKSPKIKIVTTLFPLYDFAKNIGGDYVEVFLLLPPGVEAHAFEPKPSDITKISNADIFIYTGKFMEPWVEDITKSLTNKKLIIVDASIGAKMITEVIQDSNNLKPSYDPHVWLSYDNDKIIIKNISQALINYDPVNKNYYSQNLAAYQNKLSELDAKYASSLADCQTKEIIYGGHYAFGYLANRYGLKYSAAQGLSPNSEPSAQDIINLIKKIKTDKIKYIFYEELSSPKITETLSNETGAKMLLLNAAHNISRTDIENNISFLNIMEENLINLKAGLKCN